MIWRCSVMKSNCVTVALYSAVSNFFFAKYWIVLNLNALRLKMFFPLLVRWVFFLFLFFPFQVKGPVSQMQSPCRNISEYISVLPLVYLCKTTTLAPGNARLGHMSGVKINKCRYNSFALTGLSVGGPLLPWRWRQCWCRVTKGQNKDKWMKTEGNLTSCPQNRTRRGRIETNFGRALFLAATRRRSRPENHRFLSAPVSKTSDGRRLGVTQTS